MQRQSQMSIVSYHNMNNYQPKHHSMTKIKFETHYNRVKNELLPSIYGYLLEVFQSLRGCESYLRKRRISVSSKRYKPTGNHRHSLRL
jgi:hypothetical protein